MKGRRMEKAMKSPNRIQIVAGEEIERLREKRREEERRLEWAYRSERGEYEAESERARV